MHQVDVGIDVLMLFSINQLFYNAQSAMGRTEGQMVEASWGEFRYSSRELSQTIVSISHQLFCETTFLRVFNKNLARFSTPDPLGFMQQQQLETEELHI
jgi:hypothetical protein